MRIPLSWLREYLDVKETPEELGQRLTSLGIEVEGIIYDTPSFSGVVVARVITVSPHPNADKLCVALVDDGSSQKTVVCGAPNCREGLLVALANVGAKLGIKTDGTCAIEITKATLRGVDSSGMLCSEDELGFAGESKGILELPSNFHVGESLSEKLSDVIIEVAITPNLGHCLSIEGVARELAASYGIDLRMSYELPELPERAGDWKVDRIDTEDCPSYGALVIHGLVHKESSLEMRLKLQRAGVRPQNAAVDSANFVMLSMGQPLHSFDVKAFPDHKIVVDRTQGGELIHLLDGRRLVLPSGVLAISNGKVLCAIAGVMGSEESSVTEKTGSLVVESAVFNPRAVRKSGKAAGTFSEAMRRFERGIDPNGYRRALQLYWYFLSSLCPESTLDAVVVHGREYAPPSKILCRRSRAISILGTDISEQDMELTFSRLKYPAQWVDGDTLSVSVPAYRHDVTEEIDLIEDIAKLTGFAAVTNRKKAKISPTHLPDHPLYVCEHKTRRLLTLLSLQEFLTCDLISPSLCELVADQPVPRHAIISVMNPISAEQSILRPSLFPGLVDCLRRNIAFGTKSIAAFEVGTAHLRNEGKFTERLVAGILLSGKRNPEHFTEDTPDVDFFDLKGILESFVQALGISELSIRPSSIPLFHNKRQAIVACGGQQVGMLGEIHPKILGSLDIRQRVYFMELDVQDLFTHAGAVPSMKALAAFPCMERDWTLTIPESLSFQEFIDTVLAHRTPIVEDVLLKSIFRHERVGEGKKNITLRIVFREMTRTLTQAEVDETFSNIVREVTQSLGVPLIIESAEKNLRE
jgi:phenylalanyl-tRNA synthetase beta chain